MLTLMLALALVQDPAPANAVPTDKDAEAAVKKLKEAIAASNADDSKIAAVKEALQTKHERVIKDVGLLLGDGSEKVRVGVALAMGDTDHPACVDMLIAAVSASEKKPITLAAAAKALGTLGYEAGARKLNGYVDRAGDADIREALPEIMDALGAIGSISSIDPLCDIIRKLEGPRRNPWPNEANLRGSARKALQAITGIPESKIQDWEDEWKSAKAGLMASAKVTYWLKKTHERVTQGATDKAPADAIIVGTRLTDPPAPAGEKGDGKGGGRKKKKGQ
jgi:HEAT repeat protein